MNSKEIKQKFTEMLATLPDDKRQQLYLKLKSMPENEREALIATIVERYEASRRPAQNR